MLYISNEICHKREKVTSSWPRHISYTFDFLNCVPLSLFAWFLKAALVILSSQLFLPWPLTVSWQQRNPPPNRVATPTCSVGGDSSRRTRVLWTSELRLPLSVAFSVRQRAQTFLLVIYCCLLRCVNFLLSLVCLD